MHKIIFAFLVCILAFGHPAGAQAPGGVELEVERGVGAAHERHPAPAHRLVPVRERRKFAVRRRVLPDAGIAGADEERLRPGRRAAPGGGRVPRSAPGYPPSGLVTVSHGVPITSRVTRKIVPNRKPSTQKCFRDTKPLP